MKKIILVSLSNLSMPEKFFRLIVFLMLLIVVSPRAGAELLEKGVAICAAIEGDLERLVCFDTLARGLGLVEPQPDLIEIDDGGKWRVKVEQNPIDDTQTVNLALLADSGRSSFGTPIGLFLRCLSNKTEVYINWGDYLGDEANILCRVGRQNANRRRWSLSTDHTATFFPGNDIVFIKQLTQVDRLTCQVTPYMESPVTAVFDLTGLKNAVTPLRETCGW